MFLSKRWIQCVHLPPDEFFGTRHKLIFESLLSLRDLNNSLPPLMTLNLLKRHIFRRSLGFAQPQRKTKICSVFGVSNLDIKL